MYGRTKELTCKHCECGSWQTDARNQAATNPTCNVCLGDVLWGNARLAVVVTAWDPGSQIFTLPQAEVILNIWKTFKQCYVPTAYYVLSFRNLIFKKGGLPEKSSRKTNKVVQRAETGRKQGRFFHRPAALTVYFPSRRISEVLFPLSESICSGYSVPVYHLNVGVWELVSIQRKLISELM